MTERASDRIDGFVKIDLSDGEHTIVFDYGAMEHVQEETGKTLVELQEVMSDNPLDTKTMKTLLSASLDYEKAVKDEARYTDNEIKKMLVGVNPMYVVGSLIEALGKLMDQFNLSMKKINLPQTPENLELMKKVK